MRPRALLPLLLTLALPLSMGACGGREPSGPVRLLVDGEHRPDVLTERRDVANPPALGGNRFLTGWWPWREEGTLVLSPVVQGARMEIVHLGTPGDGRRRTLVLDLLQAAPGRKVRVQAAGRDLGAFPLTDPVEIPLPDELPVGRVLVELSFEEGSRGVVAAALRPSLPEGRVRVRDADLIQSGDSLVDLVQPVAGGAGEALVGAFVPPAEPEPGQRFDLILEREDGEPIRRFSWSSSFWNRLRGTRDFALPLGEGVQGFVRVRLQAHGKGPAGRWKRLGLQGGTPPSPPKPAPAPDRFPPPRLIIVYIMDALRADAVGVLGGPPGISPTWDRLAREGILFRRHRSVAPNTLPSTKALFTGRTFVSRGGWKLEPEDGPTLAEMYRQAGYRTGLFSGNVYVSPAYKTDRGFDHDAPEVQIDAYTVTEQRPYNDNAAQAHKAALAWLRSLRPGEKAFLYIHTIHPHNPYDPPEPFQSEWTRGIPSAIDGSTNTLHDVKRARRETSEADRRRLRGLYNGSFAYNDAELDGFLRDLAALVPPAETLIAMTADHGEEHFDHGGILHGFTLYEELLRIPMLLWAPGRLRPAQVDAPTDTLDLHATLIGLSGLKPPTGHSTPGRSMLAVERGEAPDLPHLAAASSVKGGIYSASSGRWKVVWAPRVGIGWGEGDGIGRSRDPEYLYDLEKDPGEKINLAGRGDLAAAWLRSRLLAWIERNRKPDDEPKKSEPLDPETLGRLRALGYAN